MRKNEGRGKKGEGRKQKFTGERKFMFTNKESSPEKSRLKDMKMKEDVLTLALKKKGKEKDRWIWKGFALWNSSGAGCFEPST
jgi:hypothetical protein